MEVKVCPSESDLEDPVQVCQCAVGADQEPSPQHRVDAANPSISERGGLSRRVHGHGRLADGGLTRDFRRPLPRCHGLRADPALRWTPSLVLYLDTAHQECQPPRLSCL